MEGGRGGGEVLQCSCFPVRVCPEEDPAAAVAGAGTALPFCAILSICLCSVDSASPLTLMPLPALLTSVNLCLFSQIGIANKRGNENWRPRARNRRVSREQPLFCLEADKRCCGGRLVNYGVQLRSSGVFCRGVLHALQARMASQSLYSLSLFTLLKSNGR